MSNDLTENQVKSLTVDWIKGLSKRLKGIKNNPTAIDLLATELDSSATAIQDALNAESKPEHTGYRPLYDL